MHKSAYMNMYVNTFKALSDETRLRIIRLLAKASSPLCVCEIVDSLDESQYNISRHLRVLKASGFVHEKKDGKWVFYSLPPPTSRFQDLLCQTVLALPLDLLSVDDKRFQKRLSL